MQPIGVTAYKLKKLKAILIYAELLSYIKQHGCWYYLDQNNQFPVWLLNVARNFGLFLERHSSVRRSLDQLEIRDTTRLKLLTLDRLNRYRNAVL